MPLLSRDLRHAARRAAWTAACPALVLSPLCVRLGLLDALAVLAALVVVGLAAGATAPLERAARRGGSPGRLAGLALASWALWLAGLLFAAGQVAYTRVLLRTGDVGAGLASAVATLGGARLSVYLYLWVLAGAATLPAAYLTLGRQRDVVARLPAERPISLVALAVLAAPYCAVVLLEGARYASAPAARGGQLWTPACAGLVVPVVAFVLGAMGLTSLRVLERQARVVLRRLRRRFTRARARTDTA